MLRKIFMLYSVNSLSFLANLALIPIILHSTHYTGYGIYSIYISLSTTILLLDNSLAKSIYHYANLMNANNKLAISMGLNAYLAEICILFLLSPLLGMLGEIIYPIKHSFLHAGFWVSYIAVLEYIMSLPGQFLQTCNILEKRHRAYANQQLFVLSSRFIAVTFSALLTHDIRLIMLSIIIRKPFDWLFTFFQYRQHPYLIKFQWNWQILQILYRRAVPILGSLITQVLVIESVSIYINYYYGLTALGQYRSFYDVMNKIWFIATVYPILIFPSFCSALSNHNKKSSLVLLYPEIVSMSMLFYSSIALVLLIAYKTIVIYWNMLSVPEYLVGVMYGILMSAHSKIGIELLQAMNKSKFNIFINSIATMTVIVILLFSYHQGKFEISFAWIIGQSMICLMVDLCCFHYLGIPYKRIAPSITLWILILLVIISAHCSLKYFLATILCALIILAYQMPKNINVLRKLFDVFISKKKAIAPFYYQERMD